MKQVGFIGWRGMVGSVLLDRMRQEAGFEGFEPVFFTTSQAGQDGPDVGVPVKPLADALDVAALSEMDIILTCQGGSYTNEVYPKLREAGWGGYWIDAASALRMDEDSCIVLDPVNRPVIDRALDAGIKNFIGGNCTVSLMLMGVQGLFDQDWVEWMTSMTYQSASGAGARNMKELIAQMSHVHAAAGAQAVDPAVSALEVDRLVSKAILDASCPTDEFGVPLAGSLIPWIDRLMDNGQTREEWKAEAEANRILETKTRIPMDGQCVRISALRCHSQALTIKLKQDIPIADIEQAIAGANEWVELIPNEKEATVAGLTPAAVNGHMKIPVGRLRKMTIGPEYLTLFTVGDQLLWGAAEPVYRMLRILLGKL